MNFTCTDGKWKRHPSGEPVETFPIQADKTRSVPLEIAEEAYKEYSAQYGSRQSLGRLGERGGFGAMEMVTLLYERIKRLEVLVDA